VRFCFLNSDFLQIHRKIIPYFCSLMKYILLIILAISGCATLSPEKKAYIESTNAYPLNFLIANDSLKTALRRTAIFIVSSGIKITQASDTLICTREPNELMGEYGYNVSFKKHSDSTLVNVECTATSISFVSRDKNAQSNAHIAARYIKTGDNPFPELIYK
jgi:hypothetical protein